jgi:hypothetical protein
MIGTYALRSSFLLNGVTSMPFLPGCHRPFYHSASVVLLLMLPVASVLFVYISLLFFCLRCYRKPPPVNTSAWHHSVRRRSPALRPVFYQLARTGFLWKVADLNRLLTPCSGSSFRAFCGLPAKS